MANDEGSAAVVVLLPPLDQTCEHFDAVLPELPEGTAVLRAERPRQRPGLRAVRALVDDLADLDEAVRGHRRPLVLVGASYGGLLARAFAGRHPGRVGGVVLVDAVHEGVYDGVRAEVGDEAHDVLANGEGLDLEAVFTQARRLVPPSLGDVPVVALARDRLRDDERAVHPGVEALDRVWREHQERFATCSRRARLEVVAGAGHFIAREAPARVAAAVREVSAAV